jgi:exopolysaccharide biosynthesis polyprenyl glycosylphosphotransferase
VKRPWGTGSAVDCERSAARDTHFTRSSSERTNQHSGVLRSAAATNGELSVGAASSPASVLRRLRAHEKSRYRLPVGTAVEVSPGSPEAATRATVPAVTLGTQAPGARRPDTGPPPAPRGILQAFLEGPGRTIVGPTLDFALVSAAVVLALGGVGGALKVSTDRFAGFALPALVVVMLFVLGGYRRRLRVLILDWLRPVVSGVTLATMTLAAGDLLGNGEITSRGTWLRAWLLTLVAVAAGRLAVAFVHKWARSRRLLVDPVLIVGAGTVGSRVARRLEAHPEYGLVPVGFVDDDPRLGPERGGSGAPVLGGIHAIDDVLSDTGARTVIVAFGSAADGRISGLIRRCQRLGVEVLVVPRMFDTINDRITYDALGGLPLLGFRAIDPHGWQFAIKHFLDTVFAAMLLIVLSPVMAAIALAVRLTSPGPILFRQQRVGRDGKVFDLYKFRSMEWQASDTTAPDDDHRIARLVENDTGPGGVEGDKRLTRIGGLLRQISFDELPQLINVLKGDMSIVGPRPERPEFVESFGRDIAGYHDRHRVKSGITGWAQVHGLRGPTSLIDRIEYDNYYVAHWSLRLDLRILILTAIALFRGG